MRKLFPLLLAAAALADAPPPSTEDALVAHVATAKFTESKTPAGAGLPAHWHSFAEYTVFLAGKGTLVLDGKQHEVSPGSYVVVPAKMVHQFTCAAGADCLLLTRRGGPADYNFAK